MRPFMQSDQKPNPRKEVPPLAFQVGNGYMYNSPFPPAFSPTLPSSVKHLRPSHGVEFQSSEVFPKNFIIFDQTDSRSRIMFNPTVGHKLNYPDFNIHASYIEDNGDNGERKDKHKEIKESSSFVEDTEDIDALLSLEEEEEEEEEDDDDEKSTARTLGSHGSNSPDSCSSYSSKPSKRGLSSSTQKSFSSSNSSNSERKRQRMKIMMKALRGIVPGGHQMNTAAVLEESVKYLKSLKMEVKKTGIGNFKKTAKSLPRQ